MHFLYVAKNFQKIAQSGHTGRNISNPIRCSNKFWPLYLLHSFTRKCLCMHSFSWRQINNDVNFLKKFAASFFCSFHIPIQMTNIQFEQCKLKKAKMVCLGLEPRAAGWKALTNPLSYKGTPYPDVNLPCSLFLTTIQCTLTLDRSAREHSLTS